MKLSELQQAVAMFEIYDDCDVGIGYECIWVSSERAHPDFMSQPFVEELNRMGWHWDESEEYWKYLV